MNNRRLLEIAEYVSLISSVAGSFAAMAFGQVLYATAPLSLSILLNLVNRYRYEQQGQSTNAAMTELQQQLSADIQSLRSSVLNLPAPVDLSDIQQALLKLPEEIAAQTRIQSRLAPLSALDLKPINEGISQLTNQYASLSESLVNVRQRLNALPQTERFDTLESELAQFSSKIAAEKTKIESRLSPLETFNFETIRSDILQLREQYATLQEFLDSLVYRMLSDGSLSSWSSNEAESRIDKIVQQYREQKRLQTSETEVVFELTQKDELQEDETDVLFDLTQEDEQEDDWGFDDEDDGKRR